MGVLGAIFVAEVTEVLWHIANEQCSMILAYKQLVPWRHIKMNIVPINSRLRCNFDPFVSLLKYYLFSI